MIHHRYGHGQIKFEGELYTFIPSFYNLAKIGDPEHIVDIYKILIDNESAWQARFEASMIVLKSCCDKEIPTSLTGEIDEKLEYSIKDNPERAISMIEVAINLMYHGVSGDIKSESKGEPLKEFDPYEYIELATQHLSFTQDEAANMSMTQFVRSMQAKFPEAKEASDPNVRVVDGVKYERFEI